MLPTDGAPTFDVSRFPALRVRGQLLRPTAAFRSYWRLAAERQQIFFRRLRGDVPPWTDDPVLKVHRFTNAYRASDRVSQYLINNVIYADRYDARSTALRILLFKIFNRIDTWEYIEENLGAVTADGFDARWLSDLLDKRLAAKERLYSAAYIMPSPKLGASRKHRNHLQLLAALLADGTLDDLISVSSLRALYEKLSSIHSFGRFLAFQFAIDLNYSALFPFNEMDFVVAGPGARDGIAKCFFNSDGVSAEDIIAAVTESADSWLECFEVDFPSLWGRALQLIDCQNLFCEVDKYARVAHPDLEGPSGRTRIKQRYIPRPTPLHVAYPPKWCSEMAPMPMAGAARETVLATSR